MEAGFGFAFAFSAGVLSFLSPCVLPLVPSYLSYLTGLSAEELIRGEVRTARRQLVSNSLAFILGFSLIFIAFGASASWIGHLLLTHQDLLRRIGGGLIILFGLSYLGLFNMGILMREVRLEIRRKPAGPVGSFLVGIAFATGWTPCIGTILGTILLYASTTESVARGIQLLAVYSIGLGLPLFLASLGLSVFLASVQRVRHYLWAVSKVSGVLLCLVGVLIFTNSFTLLTAFLSKHGIGWYIGQ